MNTTIQKCFFLNRFIILVYFLWMLEGFIGSIYFWNSCSRNIEYLFFVVFFAVALCVVVFYFLSSFKEYIIVSPSGITHKQSTFLWSDIKQVSLTRRKFPARERNIIPCLELTLPYAIHRIGLKMMSDNERRHLLDCIEHYKPITYDGKKYERNYMTWTMATMIFLFIFGNVMLLVGSKITHPFRPIKKSRWAGIFVWVKTVGE